MKRNSGILMHISSLPGNEGIGTFGKSAYDFADFLHTAGQKYWQILPLCPTSYGDSPYQSPSSFALNPLFIDLTMLQAEGLLSVEKEEICSLANDKQKVNYPNVYVNKTALLRRSFMQSKEVISAELDAFVRKHQFWLPDYALYMVLKQHFVTKEWWAWDDEIKYRIPEALTKYQEKYQEEIAYYQYLQYIAYKQWDSLKDYIHRQGLQVIGDLPIYVAGDSADTWTHAAAGIFKLSAELLPLGVAGCPPDYFSADGQHWGNTVYDWKGNKEQGYQWWIARMKQSLSIYDWVRLDHFRGLESYWEIPVDAPTAAYGSWQPGPGMEFLDALHAALGHLQIIAEDLGLMTEEVRALVRKSGFPNMKVLGFAFDSCADNEHLPYHYEKNCVAYTGTHDNDTVRGWFANTSAESRKFAKQYLNLHDQESLHWCFIRTLLASPANLSIIPMQDILGLGTEARMNTPSTLGGNNWRWRMLPGAATAEITARLKALTQLYGR